MPLDAFATLQSHAAQFGADLKINVRMPDGGWVEPPAQVGARILDILVAFGLPLRNGRQMDGIVCCGRIAKVWRDRLVPPSHEEADSLLALGGANDGLRQLNQLVMTQELDGLELELEWDALEPQSYWIAG